MTDRACRAILYGGSFDPPHLGHAACVSFAHAYDPEAEIYVVPAFVPPAGAGQIKQTATEYAHRLAMCRLAFAGLVPAAQLHISDVEASLPTPSYTLQTLHALMLQVPEMSWTLLMGADQLANLGRWHRIAELLQHANLLVVERKMDGQGESSEESLQKLAHGLQMRLIKTSDGSYRWAQGSSRQVHLAGQSLSSAASRLIRSKQTADQSEWLSEDVKNYIQQHQLYQESEA